MTKQLHFLVAFSLSCVGEDMATHSGVLAWQSQGQGALVAAAYGSNRVEHELKWLSSSIRFKTMNSINYQVSRPCFSLCNINIVDFYNTSVVNTPLFGSLLYPSLYFLFVLIFILIWKREKTKCVCWKLRHLFFCDIEEVYFRINTTLSSDSL